MIGTNNGISELKPFLNMDYDDDENYSNLDKSIVEHNLHKQMAGGFNSEILDWDDEGEETEAEEKQEHKKKARKADKGFKKFGKQKAKEKEDEEDENGKADGYKKMKPTSVDDEDFYDDDIDYKLPRALRGQEHNDEKMESAIYKKDLSNRQRYVGAKVGAHAHGKFGKKLGKEMGQAYAQVKRASLKGKGVESSAAKARKTHEEYFGMNDKQDFDIPVITPYGIQFVKGR